MTTVAAGTIFFTIALAVLAPHDTARNASTIARARLLVVYIGEAGKAQTVRLR